MELIRKYFPIVRAAGDGGGSDEPFFISMMSPDLEGDVVVPEGMDFSGYQANPIVLYLHDGFGKTDTVGLPIGTTKAIEVIPGVGIKAHGIDWTKPPRPPVMDWIQSAWEQKKLRGASIGFISLESGPNRQTGGRVHRKTQLLEWSVVPLPMHPQALRNAVGSPEDRAMVLKSLGIDDSPGPLMVTRPDGSRLFIIDDAMKQAIAGDRDAAPAEADEPVRWNRALPDVFDVAAERYDPATIEYGVAAKYLGCEVKELVQGGCSVPSPRMGSFLSALDETLGAWRVDDLRNLTWRGTEAPPVHAVIQLNAATSRDFLIHGTRFMRGAEAKLVFKVEPSWHGLAVTTYARADQEHVARAFLAATWRRAAELNYLKGEAFSLSGEFLPKTDETWDDLTLADANAQALRRTVDLVNAKGAAAPNRGLMLLGAPGTGKTLSGRIMRNVATATFIWVSARDFYRAGSFGGLTYAFDLARECAPTILFIEDVDNWLGPTTIDLLKTEMDGIGRSAGVVTVLTTNYPERMPDALIDRPGRFHDVLHFALPDEPARAAMLARWLPELTDEQRDAAAKATDGYSGAHVRELAAFVRTLREQDDLEPGAALDRALAKLREQRELITSIQTADSRYRPTKAISALIAKSLTRVTASPETKMPVPDDTPAMKRTLAGHVGASHEHLKEAVGAMAMAAAEALGVGEDEMAGMMTRCERQMLASAAMCAEMMAALKSAGAGGGLLMSVETVGLVRKEGRVLSQKNYDTLVQCHTLIGEVLEAAQRVKPMDEDEMDDDEAPMKSIDIDALLAAIGQTARDAAR